MKKQKNEKRTTKLHQVEKTTLSALLPLVLLNQGNIYGNWGLWESRRGHGSKIDTWLRGIVAKMPQCLVFTAIRALHA